MPVGRVGSRGVMQALRVLHPGTHAHIINVWVCACPSSLVCVEVPGPLRAGPMENRHQSQGRFSCKRTEEQSVHTPQHRQHTHNMCIHVSQKLKSSRPQTGPKVLLPKGRDPDNQRGSTEKNIRTSSKSAVKSIKARSLEAPTAGTKLLTHKLKHGKGLTRVLLHPQ